MRAFAHALSLPSAAAFVSRRPSHTGSVASRALLVPALACVLLALVALLCLPADARADGEATIAGRMLDIGGLPLGPAANAEFRVYRQIAGTGSWQLMTSGAPDPAGYFSTTVYPGADPAYAIEFVALLPAGWCWTWYDLNASAAFADPLTPADGEVLDLGDVTIAFGTVRGTVRTTGGAAVPAVTVEALSSHDDQVCDRAVTDTNGTYAFYWLPVATGVEYAIRVSDPVGVVATVFHGGATTYADADRIALASGADVTADVTVPEPTAFTITGRVLDWLENPAVGVDIQALDADQQVVAESTTAGDGTFAIEDLPAGPYRIHFTDPAGLYDPWYWPSGTDVSQALVVQLGVAHRSHEVIMSLQGGPNVARLHGTVSAGGQPAAGINVWMGRVGTGDQRGTTTAADGTYRIATLWPGSYKIYFDSSAGVLPAQWYDQAVDQAGAAVLTFEAGQDYTLDPALAMTLPSPTPTPTATGTPAPSPTSRPDGAMDASAPLAAYVTTMAADGDTLVAGEPWTPSVGVFVRGGHGWTLQQRLEPPAPSAEGAFGHSLAISGDTVAVGEFHDDGRGETPGLVQVYTRSGDTWSLQQTLAPTGAAFRSFGASVALDGDTLLVGAPYVTIGTDRWAGCVYAYTRSGTTWTRRAQLTCKTATEDDYFGNALAVQDGTAVVTANMKDTAARVNGGAAFVFTGDGASWTQRTTLLPGDADAAGFGDDVALDGGTAVIASTRAGDGGAVFVFNGGGASWQRQARLTGSDCQPGDHIGASVALEGDTLLMSASDGVPADAAHAEGAAYAFRRQGVAWHQDAALRAPLHGEVWWSLGAPVAVAGGDLLVSAPREPVAGSSLRGTLHSFHPYVTGIGVALAVSARDGVLANDVPPEGQTLSASLVSGVAHGALDLQPDGSFSYTPDPGWAGVDTFTYAASDGVWTSGEVAASITVRDPNAPTVSIDALPAGWVNTPVIVTLSATDDTEVGAIDYRRRATVAVPWLAYQQPLTVSSQGASAFESRARDIFGNGSAQQRFTVKVDTRRPVPKAPQAVRVARGKVATLKYVIADPRPGSPTAKVTIRLLKNGRERWRAILPGRKVGKLLGFSFRCNLARGSYRFAVSAVDAAGNASTRAASNTLTVR